MKGFRKVKDELPPGVELVAVSKTRSKEEILAIYQEGQRLFGENKALELRDKAAELPRDIEWHFIGHLQRNKVKYIAPCVALIHSVDSEKLLAEIDKRAAANHRTIDVLLQMHIAKEEHKFGMNGSELQQAVEGFQANKWPNVRLCGLMGMATHTEDDAQISAEFRGLRRLFDQLQDRDAFTGPGILSMGMSVDLGLAIAEGSTMVRVGTSIFGPRKY